MKIDRKDPALLAHTGLRDFEVVTLLRFISGNQTNEPAYATGMWARYETDEVSQLSNFIILQRIRGCVYNTSVEGGLVVKSLGFAREFQDEETRKPNEARPDFRHITWMYDSTDLDPAYATIAGGLYHRHAGYQVSRPDPFDSSTRRLAKDHGIRKPELFVSDYLKDVSKSRDTHVATNTSLEFETGLHYESAVPRSPGPAGPPISMHAWRVGFQWSYEARRFLPTVGIDPFCLSHERRVEMTRDAYEAELRSRLAPPSTCLPD